MTKKKQITLIIVAVLMLLITSSVLSFAYFTVELNGGEESTTITTEAGTMGIIFAGGSNVIVGNAFPSDNPAATKIFTVTGSNSTALMMTYSLTLVVDNNTFTDNALNYALSSTYTTLNGKIVDTSPTFIDLSAGAYHYDLGGGYFTAGDDLVHTYTLNIYFPNNPLVNQNENQGKIFAAHIEIMAGEGLDCNLNNLSCQLLANNGGTAGIKAKGTPVIQYQADLTGEVITNVIASNSNKAVATSFTMDGTYYQLTNPVTDVTYDSNHLGMYTCGNDFVTNTNNTGVNCTYLFMINTVDGSGNITNSTRYNRMIKEISTAGLYASTDDDGSSYYYWGAAQNNNVIFAGYQWKIIRMTGTGAIKLIYNGTCDVPGCAINTTGDATQVTPRAFNITYSDNRHVGYMYGDTCDTYEDCHANENDSTIKTYIDEWYRDNIANQGTSITNKIADVVYCNDRSPSTSYSIINGLGGFGTTNTYYSVYYRVLSFNKAPSLGCSQVNDRFTVSTEKGNGALTYPVGLITEDEMALAGGEYIVNNRSYYLYTNRIYWTISPYAFASDSLRAHEGRVYWSGYLGTADVSYVYGLRPVIALDGNVTVTGDGNYWNPFVVT